MADIDTDQEFIDVLSQYGVTEWDIEPEHPSLEGIFSEEFLSELGVPAKVIKETLDDMDGGYCIILDSSPNWEGPKSGGLVFNYEVRDQEIKQVHLNKKAGEDSKLLELVVAELQKEVKPTDDVLKKYELREEDEKTWFYSTRNGEWCKFDTPAANNIETTYQNYLSSPTTNSHTLTITSGKFRYLVNVKNMTQKNVDHENRRVRKILRF